MSCTGGGFAVVRGITIAFFIIRGATVRNAAQQSLTSLLAQFKAP